MPVESNDLSTKELAPIAAVRAPPLLALERRISLAEHLVKDIREN
jgi:hypothetical protein